MWEYRDTLVDAPPPGLRWERKGVAIAPAVARWRRVEVDWAVRLALEWMKAPDQVIDRRNALPVETIQPVIVLLGGVVAPPEPLRDAAVRHFAQHGGLKRIGPAVREYVDRLLRRQQMLQAVDRAKVIHLGSVR